MNMPLILKAWELRFDQYQKDEDDQRKSKEVVAEFTKSCIDNATKQLRSQLEKNNHLLTVLLADPLVQKDQKGYIEQCIVSNKKALAQFESEVVNA